MSSVCVADLMHCCASATIGSESTLRDAAERVLLTGLETLPVVDADGRFAGLVAQAALIRELLSSHSPDETIAPIVSRHVESARVTAMLDAILPLFRAAGVTMIPIVDESDCPVGLVHRRDVIQYLLDDTTPATDSNLAGDQTANGPYFLKDRRNRSADR